MLEAPVIPLNRALSTSRRLVWMLLGLTVLVLLVQNLVVHVSPQWFALQPWPPLALAVLGGSLLLLSRARTPQQFRWAQWMVLPVGILGAVKVASELLGWYAFFPGWEQWSPGAGLLMLCGAISVPLLIRGERRLTQNLILFVLLMALVSLQIQLLHPQVGTNMHSFLSFPVFTALGFVLFAVAHLMLQPAFGMSNILLEGTLGGWLARLMIPAAVLIPTLVGWVYHTGLEAGWMNADTGALFMAVFSMLFIVALVFPLARIIHDSAVQQKKNLTAVRLQEQRFKQVTESAAEGIITLDLSGNMLWWNQAARTVFGHANDDVLGSPFTVFLPPQDHIHHEVMMDRIHAGEEVPVGQTFELQGLRKNGQVFIMEVSMAVWDIETGRYCTLMVRDITLLKEAQQEARDALEYAETLLAVSRTLEEDLEPLEMARQVASRIAQSMQLDWVAVGVQQDGKLHLQPLWWSARSRGVFAAPVFPELNRGVGIGWQGLLEKRPIYVDDVLAHPANHPTYQDSGVTAVATVPILHPDPQQCMVVVANRVDWHSGWTHRDRDLFESAVRSVGIAMQRRLMVEQLHRAALTDPLTGLANRRAFMDDLHLLMEQEVRVQILVMDVDGLKKVNDSQGHERGDLLLKAYGEAFKNHLSDLGQVYRLAGDEYAALITEISGLEHIESLICQAVQDVRDAGFPDTNASVGVSVFPMEGRTIEGLVLLADQRMYQMKAEHKQAQKALPSEA